MQHLTRLRDLLPEWMQTVGPYLLLEILLPGGTLLALVLFLYRRRGHGPRPLLKSFLGFP